MKNNRIIARTFNIGLAAFVIAAFVVASTFLEFPVHPARAQGVSQSWGGTSTSSGNAYAIIVPNFDAYRP